MSKDINDPASALVDGHEPDWTTLDQDTARRLKRVQQVSRAFARARSDATEAGACQFSWCHLEVFELIGRGGFGEVYRAWDPVLKREVALKLRLEDAGQVDDQVLIEEARRLARVRHPNVLAIHGSDIDKGRAGIWCDLLEGQTLEQALVGEGALDLRRFLRLAAPLASAVAEIHRCGLVHGDIKASNVMVLSDRTPVLMDFGAGADLAEGNADVVTGSPLVMAPEHLEGEPLSTAGDIYSLGVLLFRLVAGRYPLAASDLEQLAQLHRDHVSIDWSRVPGPVLGLLKNMLGRDAGSRPTADQVESQLLDLKSRPEQRRKTAAWAAAMAALAIGATVASVAYVNARQSAQAALQAQVDSQYSLEFLQSILSSPHALERGSEVKVVEVLDDARRELEFAPPSSQRRRAAMSLVLGQTYSMLGQNGQASRLLEQALAYYQQSDCQCDDLVLTQIAVARNAIRAGEFAEAQQQLQSVEDALAEDDPLRLQLTQSWGDLWESRREEDRAIAAYREALRISEQSLEKSIIPANIRLKLATLVMRRNIAEAEQLARDARAWILSLVGGKSEFLLQANNALAAVLIEKGQFGDAETLLRESLSVGLERTPEGSAELVTILSTLSSVLDRRGLAEEAFATNERALEMGVRTRQSPAVILPVRMNQAVRLQELGRLDEAEAGYRKTLEESLRLLGDDNQFVLLSQSNLADVLLVSGQLEAAEQAAREALATNRRVAGEEHLFTLFTLDLLGASLCRQGRCTEALPLLRQAYETKTRNFGADNPYTHDSAFYLAEALIETGKTGEAAILLQGVVDNRRADLGSEHKKTREALAMLDRAQAAGG